MNIVIKYKTYWDDTMKEYICYGDSLMAERDFTLHRMHLIKSEGAKYMHVLYNNEEYDVLSPENYDNFERVLDSAIGNSIRYC